MNSLQKTRMKAVFKYSWPFYILSAVVISFAFYFIFGMSKKLPGYKKLTLFVSGEVKDSKKLNDDLLEKYQEKELKSFTSISANPDDPTYNRKLEVTGLNGSDVLIIPTSIADILVADNFALEIKDELVTYYSGCTFYEQDGGKYGVKLDKEKVKDYMNLPSEECYLFLNGKSENLGEYSKSQIKEHDLALCLVKDWGM